MMNCEVLEIRTFSTEFEGALSVFEKGIDISFDIKRVYYIFDANKGTQRGFHAHKKLRQLLFCPFGEIEIKVDDGKNKYSFILNKPNMALLIEPVVWREIIWKKDQSVLVVAVSDNYNESDYIRDYNEFLNYIKQEKKNDCSME